MIRKFTLLFFTVISFLSVQAGFTPVPVTGFNKDIVANGVGPARSSTTSSVDDTRDTAGYSFLSLDYRAVAGGTAPAFGLPLNGILNSTPTPGLSYQLAAYSGNNTLKLDTLNASGKLTFQTPVNVTDIYVLATAGTAVVTGTTALVTYTDGTTESLLLGTVNDWYGTAGTVAASGIGRVNLTNNVAEGNATTPRLYELRLTISTFNTYKQVASVSFTKTIAAGFLQIMAISANTISQCGPPTSQPTNLVLTPTVYGVSGSFSPSVPLANKYMVLRTIGTSADTPPTDGIVYQVGQPLGNATIISISAATTFTDPGLIIGTSYTYTILGFSDSTCFGISPAYNIINPLSGSATIPPCLPTPGGTYSVGPTGTYPTLTAAMTALNNAAGASGNILIELQPTYTSTAETFPIVIPNISTSPCAVGNPTLTIRPAAGATGLTITGSNATAILDFNNAKRATLDGRPGGAGTAIQLTVINTNTAGVAIRLYNDASNNTITYCDVQGQNISSTSTALSGVIYIGQANAATAGGNDKNTISYSNIHGTTTGTPAIGICAFGTSGTGILKTNYNDSCTITNCRIYDFFNATSASSGIKLDLGNNAWTITNNSIYQTASRTYTTAATHRGLWITPNVGSNDSTAGAFLITNNFIGGTAVSAGGTAYTMTGTVATVFYGMDLSVGSGAASSVQNNTVANISLTSTGTSTTTGVFVGIGTSNGSLNIGNSTGNTIGSATTSGSINVVSGSAGTSYGFRIGTGQDINLTGNTVSGIIGSGASGGTTSTNLTGIGIAGGTNVNIENNTIGSATAANSLSLTASSSTTAQSLNGISVTGGSSTSITNNTIANLTNGYTGTGAGTTRGISVSSSTTAITGNTIRNLSNAATSTSSGATSALVGIAMSSTSASGGTVTRNTIQSLISTASSTTAALNFTGIYYSGTIATTSSITKNFIHSFDAAALNPNITFTGIDFATAAATIANNMIRLGIKPDGTSLTSAAVIRGISSNSSSSTNNFYYNSIYIGGTGVESSAGKNSYAFIRTATSGTYDIRNNLFINSRSSVAAGSKHYALYFTTAVTGAATNYNVYNANGTGGVFAYNGTADVAAYTSGWLGGDANSAYGNPGFINATGTAATLDLHINAATPSIAESAGTPVAFLVSDDYDGNPRSTTLPDAGADEFTGVNPNLCSGTPTSGTVSSSSATVCAGVNFTLSVANSTGTPGISYQWQSSTDSTNWTNIGGATSSTLTTSQTVRTYYRIVVRCTNSNVSATSAGLSVALTTPTYAIYNATSYTESFENWINSCSTTDLPGISWRNTPVTGNNSWRRNDQGASADWVNNTLGTYTPAATLGTYSARFHSYQTPAGVQGALDFYVNMSAAGASTNIKFDYINTSGNDSLTVLLSTNGGTTFTRLDSVGLRTAWRTKTINISSTAANTVIRLQATSDFGTTDIGIDNFQLVNFAPCSGTPVAGTVFSSANPVCAGVSFTLSDTLVSQLAGITYQWQSSPNCQTWTNIAGATGLSYTTSQTVATNYRLVVTCASGGASASTACYTINMSAPTGCYCTPTYSSGGAGDNVTSVALGTLVQTITDNVTPYYFNYTTIQNAIPLLTRSTTYPLTLNFGSDGNQYNGVWIDFNQDGAFGTTEYFTSGTNAGSGGTATVSIVIPPTATLGQTRMRIRGGDDSQPAATQSCGASSSAWGQALDFLVNITDGTVPIRLISFTGERKASANLLNWTTASEQKNKGFEVERSADGSHFTAIGFIASKAVNGNSNSNLNYSFTDLQSLTGNNYYRLKQVDKDGLFEYSTIVFLKGDKVNALTLSLVYPNPTKDKLNVIIASPKADKLTLIVSDGTGKIVREQRVTAFSGDNLYEINVQSLTSGNYTIKAICKDGCETVISRFVKL